MATREHRSAAHIRVVGTGDTFVVQRFRVIEGATAEEDRTEALVSVAQSLSEAVELGEHFESMYEDCRPEVCVWLGPLLAYHAGRSESPTFNNGPIAPGRYEWHDATGVWVFRGAV
jgi:hypothetical protein